MLILALDNGARTGWAAGEAGKFPSSGSEKISVPMTLRWLDQWFKGTKPDLVVVEAPLALKAYAKLGTSEAAVYDALARHGIIESVCWYWGVKHELANVLTVRKHFTGRATHGSREASKRAVISRCWQLKYVLPTDYDEDRCDALAIWDWASVTFGRVPPKELVLFGGG